MEHIVKQEEQQGLGITPIIYFIFKTRLQVSQE